MANEVVIKMFTPPSSNTSSGAGSSVVSIKKVVVASGDIPDTETAETYYN